MADEASPAGPSKNALKKAAKDAEKAKKKAEQAKQREQELQLRQQQGRCQRLRHCKLRSLAC